MPPHRHLITALLAVLVLVQAFLLQHEQEHALGGDEKTCLVCHLAGHQGAALPSTAIAITIPSALPPAPRLVTTFIPTLPRYFAVRAPPTHALV